MVLWSKALKPGGIYFIEDLSIARHPNYISAGEVVMPDVLRDWMETILRKGEIPYEQIKDGPAPHLPVYPCLLD